MVLLFFLFLLFLFFFFAFTSPQVSLNPSTIFFITFLISYTTSLSLCNCNTNSYCDLCWYQWTHCLGFSLFPLSFFFFFYWVFMYIYSLWRRRKRQGPDIMFYWIRVVSHSYCRIHTFKPTYSSGYASFLSLSLFWQR